MPPRALNAARKSRIPSAMSNLQRITTATGLRTFGGNLQGLAAQLPEGGNTNENYLLWTKMGFCLKLTNYGEIPNLGLRSAGLGDEEAWVE